METKLLYAGLSVHNLVKVLPVGESQAGRGREDLEDEAYNDHRPLPDLWDGLTFP
jgi:hypothetical protein